MDALLFFIDFILHLDKHLTQIIQNFGVWTYLILFLIVFFETGLVVTPILPGDSLLFAVGAFAAVGTLDLRWLFLVLTGAAIIGDSVNYAIGKFVGPKVFKEEKSKFFKKEYLEKTKLFYEKHGNKTIVLARFVPIIRTFAPFVAGIGSMQYSLFLFYNILGAVLWVSLCLLAGYFFGNISIVKENFSIVVLLIVFISVLPVIFEIWKHRTETAKKK
jgi:membrane-associated protein